MLRATGRDDVLDVGELLVSEVVTNAVLYAHSEIGLRVAVRPTGVRVEVGDASSVLPSPRRYGTEALTGRGLALVEALATTWGVDRAAAGKVVWFELAAGADAAAPVDAAPSDADAAAPAGPMEDEGAGAPAPPGASPFRPAGGDGYPGADRPAGHVHLRGAPATLLRGCQEHGDALLRELVLLGPGAGDGAGEHPAGLGGERLRSAQAAQGLLSAEVAATAAGGQRRVDVVLTATPGLGDAARDLRDVLEAADRLARRGRLLVRPALAELHAFRWWLLSEVVAQADGAAPTPWDPAPAAPVEPERPLAEIDAAAILEGFSDAVVAADDDNRILYVNAAAEQLLGWPRAELQGRRLTTIIPPRLHDAHVAGFTRYLLTGEATILGRPVRVPARRRDGTEVQIDLTLNAFRVSGDRRVFVGSLRDMTERTRLERQVALTDLLRATSEVAVRLGLGRDVTSIEQAAPLVLAALGEPLGWELGALWVVEPDTDELACVDVWRAGGATGGPFEVLTRRARFPRGVGLPGRVWETAAPTTIDDVVNDLNFPRARAAREEGFHGAFAFPLVSPSGVRGAVEFYSREATGAEPDLVAAVTTVGGHLGLFVERLEAEAQLRHHRASAATHDRATAALARTLQASLLPPHLPTIPGFDVASRFRAAEGTLVGGDFYDLFPLSHEEWVVVVGDVCGKGAAAAALTGLARYTVRAAAMHHSRPSGVLSDLNLALRQYADSAVEATVTADLMSCTGLYLRIASSRGTATVGLAVAGHPLPLLVRPDGSTAYVGATGTLLGPFPDPELNDDTLELQAGEALVLYTDGVTEARGEEGFFGEDRLAEAAAGAAGQRAAGIAGAVDDAVLTFTGGRRRDDVAVVVLVAAPVPPPR